MIVFIAFNVFLATLFGVLVVFFWLESMKESLSHRVRQFSPGSQKTDRNLFRETRGRVAETWKRFVSKTPTKEEFLALFTGKELSGTRLLLSQAGYRKPMAYRFFLWAKVGLPVLMMFIVVALVRVSRVPGKVAVMLAMAGFLIGLLLPDMWIRDRGRKRRMELEDALPDGMDLLSVCVDAGLGLNSGFVKLSEEFQLTCPPLSEEFDIVNREMMAGKPRQEALRALADRTGVEDVKSFVAMLIQTEKLGTSLSQSLRVHADSLRTKRRQRAEEAAAKTTIKLVFPLVLLLFPALFIVVLGPGILQVFRVLSPIIHR